jgi:hypothetical protein
MYNIYVYLYLCICMVVRYGYGNTESQGCSMRVLPIAVVWYTSSMVWYHTTYHCTTTTCVHMFIRRKDGKLLYVCGATRHTALPSYFSVASRSRSLTHLHHQTAAVRLFWLRWPTTTTYTKRERSDGGGNRDSLCYFWWVKTQRSPPPPFPHPQTGTVSLRIEELCHSEVGVGVHTEESFSTSSS